MVVEGHDALVLQFPIGSETDRDDMSFGRDGLRRVLRRWGLLKRKEGNGG